MAWRQASLGQRLAQHEGLPLSVATAGEIGLEPVELVQLVLRRERGMVGDVVGNADEFIEGQDQGAVTRFDDP